MATRTAAFTALGGALFGVDVGYISGVQEMRSFHESINDGEPLTASIDGIIVALFAVGAILSSSPPVAGYIGSKLGGRRAVVLGGSVFCAGSLLQGLAHGLWQFGIGRTVSGAAVGILSTYVPLYQSEVSEPQRRGGLVALYQLAITLGVCVAFWINLAVRDASWRISVLTQCVPGALLTVGMLAMPDSPRWLIAKGDRQRAASALTQLRSAGHPIDAELQEMTNAAERDALQQGSWLELCQGTSRRACAIGVTLQVLQQLCGMNVFMLCARTLAYPQSLPALLPTPQPPPLALARPAPRDCPHTHHTVCSVLMLCAPPPLSDAGALVPTQMALASLRVYQAEAPRSRRARPERARLLLWTRRTASRHLSSSSSCWASSTSSQRCQRSFSSIALVVCRCCDTRRSVWL